MSIGSETGFGLRLAAEGLVIVVAVLVALAAHEWLDARAADRRVDTVLAGFQQEIQGNLDQVKERLPYHVTLRTRFRELANAESPPESLDQLFESIPEWQGVRMPLLMDVAWDAARGSDVLPRMDYSVITTLAAAYRQQEWLEQRIRRGSEALEPRSVAVDALPYTIRSSATFFEEVVSMEGSLYCQYMRVLDLLERARSEPGDSAAAGSEPYVWPEGRVDTLVISPISKQPVTVGC